MHKKSLHNLHRKANGWREIQGLFGMGLLLLALLIAGTCELQDSTGSGRLNATQAQLASYGFEVQ